MRIKRKGVFAAACLLAAAMLLPGCGAKKQMSQTEREQERKRMQEELDGDAEVYEGTDVDDVAMDEGEMTADEQYDFLLSLYYDMLKNGTTPEEFQEMAASDLVIAYNRDLNLDTIGYAFYEDTLLIGCVYSNDLSLAGEVTDGVFIAAYYVNEENELTNPANSWRTSYYYICSDGTLAHQDHATYEFLSSSGEEETVFCDIFDDGGWHRTAGGVTEAIQDEEAWRIINSHVPEKITFTPFSKWKSEE